MINDILKDKGTSDKVRKSYEKLQTVIDEVLEEGGDTTQKVKKGYEKAKDIVNDMDGSDITEKMRKGYDKVKKVFDDMLDETGLTPNVK